MKRFSDRDIRAIIRENKKLKIENKILLGEIENTLIENTLIENTLIENDKTIINVSEEDELKLNEEQINLDYDSVLQELLV
jgi:translation elongation factor EF-Ts